MKKLTAFFVTATLLLNAVAPALAHAATYLQGTEVNASTLVQDAYVAVTYYDSKGKQKLAKGWIDAIDETTFQIRSRAIFGKETIAYDKVLSVIMSDESTVPAKQMNEVNQFIGEMRERETREAEQAAIQQLKDKIVMIGQFDFSKKEWYAHVVYTSDGKKAATGKIIERHSDHIVIRVQEDTGLKIRKTIAYTDIDTLFTIQHTRDIEAWRNVSKMGHTRLNQKYARVRVQAPSISDRRMVGTLIQVTQDTLIIQYEQDFLKMSFSSISSLEVGIIQRNTSKGILIGLGLGLASFIAVAKSLESNDQSPMAGLALMGFGIYVSIPICILSTLIGAKTESDKWVEVPPQSLNLSLAPLPAWPLQTGTPAKGLRAALTFNF